MASSASEPLTRPFVGSPVRHLPMLVLTCLAAASAPAGERGDLPYLVASLDSSNAQVVEDAQRRLLILGPEALPLLRSAANDELARRANLFLRIDRLVRELDADDYHTRERAEADLVEIGSEALPALRDVSLRGTPEQVVRAQHAIDRIGARPPTLPRFLFQIARAIAAQPDDACVATLVAIARQPEQPLMMEAIEGLWRLGTPTAIEALSALATDAQVDRRWLSLAALVAAGEDVHLDARRFVAEWPCEDTRNWVYAALRYWESRELIPFALAAMEREGVSAPIELRSVIERTTDPDLLTTQALRSLRLNHEWCRAFLVSMLRAPTEEAIAATISALSDRDWHTRAASAFTLARLIGGRAAERLAPLLEDPEPAVRLAALRALHAVGGPDPRPFLRVLADPLLGKEAVEYALVRMPGAHRIRAIESRSGGPTASEWGVIDRWLTGTLNESFAPALQEPVADPRGVLLGCVRDCVLEEARLLLGPLPPRPIETSTALSRFRELLSLDATARGQAIRASLRAPEMETRREVLRWAVWEDMDGFEEDVLPFLSCDDPATEEIARRYLRPRRHARLLEAVRRMALGAAPGAAALLWVQWEGRTAVQGILARLAEPGTLPRGLVSALADGPLATEDATILLSVSPPSSEVEDLWKALRRIGTAPCVDRLRWAALQPDTAAQAALHELAQDTVHADFVLRLTRSRRRVRFSSMPKSSAVLDRIGARAGIAELAVAVPDAMPTELQGFARAAVRCDPSGARELAATWRTSLHLARRQAAIWISHILGEEVPEDTIGVLRVGETQDRPFLAPMGRDTGSLSAIRACVGLLTDPDPSVRASAWTALAEGLGETPPGWVNTFATPTQLRDAWQAWLDGTPRVDRRQIIERYAAREGWPGGDEAVLHALVRAPHPVCGAAFRELGLSIDPEWDPTQALVDEAVRCRDSLR